jgi:hypothetical protein
MARSASPAARATAPSRSTAATGTRRPARVARRRSGPVRVGAGVMPAAAAATAAGALVVRPALRVAGSLSRSPLLDRFLRGRAWIGLIGALLVGIVFLNVSLLSLNAGIATSSEHLAKLKLENGRLRLRAARLGSSERIQRTAEARGFVFPAPGKVRYLRAGTLADARLAAVRIRPPEQLAETAGAATSTLAQAPPAQQPPPAQPPPAQPPPAQPPPSAPPAAGAQPPAGQAALNTQAGTPAAAGAGGGAAPPPGAGAGTGR